MAEERLQRALARAGFGSRRACEELIVEGRVTLDGRVATLGDKVDAETRDGRVDGVERQPRPQRQVLRPPQAAGRRDDDATTPRGAPTSAAYLPAEGPRVFPVGRLDRDSEGLLLLTNDGDLANRLMHPSFGVEKEYLAEVEGAPTAKHLGPRCERGSSSRTARLAPCARSIVAASRGRGAVRLVMTEGRKREVRRLLAAVGLPGDAPGAAADRPTSGSAGSRRASAASSPLEEVLALARLVAGAVACGRRRGASSRQRGRRMRVRAARGAIVVSRG